MSTKGLHIDLQDANTGAIAGFHVVEYYSIDVKNRQSIARLSGYVSESTYDGNKAPLVSHNVTIPLCPGLTDYPIEWIYDQLILVSENNNQDNQSAPNLASNGNVFQGATKIASQ
jgi:hypothetical protein